MRLVRRRGMAGGGGGGASLALPAVQASCTGFGCSHTDTADGWDPKPEPVIDMVLVPSVGTTSGAGEVAVTVGGSYCKPVGVRVAD